MIRHALRKKMLMRQKLNVGRRKVILLEDGESAEFRKQVRCHHLQRLERCGNRNPTVPLPGVRPQCGTCLGRGAGRIRRTARYGRKRSALWK